MTNLTSKYRMKRYMLFFIFAGSIFSSCKKFVEVSPPPNQLSSGNVFTSDASATSAVTGIYTRMSAYPGFASGGSNSISLLCGLSADDFQNFTSDPNYIGFANNSISVNNSYNLGLWKDAYQYIYTTNAILEGLNSSSGVSLAVKNELIGESKFVRAFCYFYLTNLFGDVPLNLTSNYQVNEYSPRTSSTTVYQQITADLKDAQSLLSPDYSFSNGERVRPNKWVATALLSRAYLYQNKWDSAEAQANSIINYNTLFSLTGLDSVFLANSNEAIWQLLPVDPGLNTQDGYNYILNAQPTLVSLDSFLLNAFEIGDNRFANWVSSFTDGTNVWYFPFKYKVKTSSTLTEYSIVFRLAEQYLIRSEARTEQNNIAGAQADLNLIRHRAGLNSTVANDQPSLLSAIAHERQVELFSEFGHRWLDLKRTNQADVILGSEKPGWSANAKLYPIPSIEIIGNKSVSQNPGY
jgi:starch-binding outer membrane protein, SusD/RagB family